MIVEKPPAIRLQVAPQFEDKVRVRRTEGKARSARADYGRRFRLLSGGFVLQLDLPLQGFELLFEFLDFALQVIRLRGGVAQRGAEANRGGHRRQTTKWISHEYFLSLS